ncbi:MAG: aldehyde ferredoxin oxidoreductase N-terminal domain-containing protein, partial [Desulfofustis sp.]
MAFGYNGKILVVDLTSGTHEVREPEERWYRTYFGGTGIIAETLLEEDITGADPLGPDNVLIFTCSVVTGAPISGFNRYSVGAKSP